MYCYRLQEATVKKWLVKVIRFCQEGTDMFLLKDQGHSLTKSLRFFFIVSIKYIQTYIPSYSIIGHRMHLPDGFDRTLGSNRTLGSR